MRTQLHSDATPYTAAATLIPAAADGCGAGWAATSIIGAAVAAPATGASGGTAVTAPVSRQCQPPAQIIADVELRLQHGTSTSATSGTGSCHTAGTSARTSTVVLGA